MPDRGANEPQNMTAASAACRPPRSCALTRRRGDRGPTPDQIAVITAVTLARQNSIGQRLPANFPEHVVDPGARLASNSCGNVAQVRKQRRRQEEGVTSSSRLMKANPQPFQLLQTDARLSGSTVFPPRRWPPRWLTPNKGPSSNRPKDTCCITHAHVSHGSQRPPPS